MSGVSPPSVRSLALGLALAALASPAHAAEVRLGPILGASLLEHRDTSLTHGALVDEVTVGRTVLAGLTVDLRFTAQDSLAFEILVGPYHSDVERSCINRVPGPPCQPVPFKSAARALLYGMRYVRTLSSGTWAPYLAGGIGAKSYTYREGFHREHASPTLGLALGVQREGRFPFRVELGALLVQDNPLLLDRTQLELQARATLLIG